MKKYFTISLLFIFFCTQQSIANVGITVEPCLTGEHVRLTAYAPTKFSYHWSTGQKGSSIIVKKADLNKSYTCTYTCPNGCHKTRTVRLNNNDLTPHPPTAQKTNVTCYNTQDGAIKLNVPQGIAPFKYQWSDGSTEKNRTGLSGGNYEVTITDVIGCSETINVAINEPDSLSNEGINILTKDAICHGTATGEIAIKITDNQPNDYYFHWKSGSIEKDRTALPSGTYQVYIYKNNKCRSENIDLDEPERLNPSIEPVSNYNGFEVSCSKAADGVLSVEIAGGTAPYNLKWNKPRDKFNNLSDTVLIFSNLKAATYTATVTDANGCEQIIDKTITAPKPITNTEIIKQYGDYHISCRNAADGEITLQTTGGAGNFQYEWMTQKDTFPGNETLNNADSGKYKVKIRDANGCQITTKFQLQEPQILDASKIIVREQNDHVVVKLKIQGGMPDYYLNGKKLDKNQTITLPRNPKNLIVLSDKNGCTKEKNWKFPRVKKEEGIIVKGNGRKASGKANPADCPKLGRK